MELARDASQLDAKATSQMAFDIINWKDTVIMNRDLKILEQARTIAVLKKEIVELIPPQTNLIK